MSMRIPATVVTGFLGAGKTTLIRHLLRNARGRRLALIVNEFGEIGIDGEILRSCNDQACAEEDIIELANGCICCTVADDFLPTMQKLLDRVEPPDHIIIETSGLALPKPLVQAFNWPEIKAKVSVDGVVSVVDGEALKAGRFTSDIEALERQRAADPSFDHDSPIEELFEDQLACADLIILNKSDLLDSLSLEEVRKELFSRAPTARLISVAHGEIDPAIALGLGVAAEETIFSKFSHHDGEEDHEHDEFKSFHLDLPEQISAEVLSERLRDVLDKHDILRVKGFVAITDKPMRMLVQAVGRRLNFYFDRPWMEDEPRQTRLVFIGKEDINEAAIRAAMRG